MFVSKFKSTILAIAIAATNSTLAFAADSAIKEGLKLGEKRKYDEAVVKILENMSTYNDQEKENAYLIMGLMSLRSAELYKAFARLNAESLEDSYQLLSNEKKEFRSKYLDFYRAELAVTQGKCKDVSSSLNSLSSNKQIDADHQAMAMVLQAECAMSQKASDGEAKLKKIGKSSAAIEVAKLATSAKFSKKQDNISSDWKKLATSIGADKSPRIASNGAVLYALSDEYEAAILFLKDFDLSRPDFEEASKGKSIFFYDASLLGNISKMYFGASRYFLSKVKDHPKLGAQAKLYIAQSYIADNGDVGDAAKIMVSPDDSGLSAKAKQVAAVTKAAIDEFGATKKVIGGKLVAGNEQQLDMVGEALRVCRQLNQVCDELIDIGKKSGGEAFGAKFVNLNRAMGEQYLMKNDVTAALKYLEFARDKSNKNKIEANDPMLLVALADGYRQSKSYNESLEILFEFAKHFPAVRQTQEALQSIYSVEHKSAGDVRIF